MFCSNLESLPADVFLTLIDQLDLPTKALLARCSKTLQHAIGANVLNELQKHRDSRRKFLLLLEKDCPTDQFFCPGCDLFHNISRQLVGDKAPCRRADFRNEVNEFYGAHFNFYQARFALRLYRRKDSRAHRYLKDLERIEPRTQQIREFWSRNLRIVTIHPDQPPQMFLRLQHWHLISPRDVKKKMPEEFHSRDVQICHHQRNPQLSESWSRLAPFQLGFLMIKKQISRWSDVTDLRPDYHEHTQLYHCRTCATDYRMDILYIPKTPLTPLHLFSRGILPRWAVVVTKWMDLGTLDTQDGEWQAHAYAERGKELRYTVNRLTPGSAVHIFEKKGVIGDDLGELDYKPCWSEDFETKVIAAFK